MAHLIDKSAIVVEIEYQYILKKTPTYNASQAIINLEKNK
jgi:hypothetical protein